MCCEHPVPGRGPSLLVGAVGLAIWLTRLSFKQLVQAVDLLRSMGAKDRYIAQQFEQHALGRARCVARWSALSPGSRPSSSCSMVAPARRRAARRSRARRDPLGPAGNRAPGHGAAGRHCRAHDRAFRVGAAAAERAIRTDTLRDAWGADRADASLVLVQLLFLALDGAAGHPLAAVRGLRDPRGDSPLRGLLDARHPSGLAPDRRARLSRPGPRESAGRPLHHREQAPVLVRDTAVSYDSPGYRDRPQGRADRHSASSAGT